MINLSVQNKESEEVYNSDQKCFSIYKTDVQNLIQLAKTTRRKRVRYCSHSSAKELVHEMFIVHPKGAYIRPHKHLKKTESMFVLDGEVDYVIFDDEGEVINVVPMGNFQSNKSFYQSTRTELFHSLIIHSDWLVFLEITQGPFEKDNVVFAEWSPEEIESIEVNKFTSKIKKIVEQGV